MEERLVSPLVSLFIAFLYDALKRPLCNPQRLFSRLPLTEADQRLCSGELSDCVVDVAHPMNVS